MAEMQSPQVHDKLLLQRQDIQSLLDALHRREYTTIGPTIRDEVIVCDEIDHVEDLPIGWGDEQSNGRYRLRKLEEDALFGYTVSPLSWKRYFYPPVQPLFRAIRSNGQYRLETNKNDLRQYAMIGVRPCDLTGIAMLDAELLGGKYKEPTYQEMRRRSFIVAANCGHPSGTCFCASMGTGPQATDGYDLALTEVIGKNEHYFVLEVGSDKGAALAARLPCRPAEQSERKRAESVVRHAAKQMGREVETDGLRDAIYRNLESQHWERAGNRCLACGNCTMVCPTCFCTTVEDTTDLSGDQAERIRIADSCFSDHFTYIHGGSVRSSTMSRYRQWITHKFATSFDQFGSFGCVGCGRCITWCPVGIDVTEEVRRIQQSDALHA